MYVYLFGDHDEYGTEHVKATLNRNKILDLFELYWNKEEEYENYIEQKENLIKFLKKSDKELACEDPYELESGWVDSFFML